MSDTEITRTAPEESDFAWSVERALEESGPTGGATVNQNPHRSAGTADRAATSGKPRSVKIAVSKARDDQDDDNDDDHHDGPGPSAVAVITSFLFGSLRSPALA
jgi:hypothetical protein